MGSLSIRGTRNAASCAMMGWESEFTSIYRTVMSSKVATGIEGEGKVQGNIGWSPAKTSENPEDSDEH